MILALLLLLAQRDPRAAESHFRRGIEHAQKGEHRQARDAYLEALKLAPGSAAVLNNLGVTALELGQEREAGDYFRQALALDADNPDAALNLGLMELKGKRFAEAARLLAKTAERRPHALVPLQGWLEAEMALGGAARVKQIAGRILQLAPREPRFYFQLASPLADRGFHEAALMVLEGARTQWPESADVASNLAVAHFLAGRVEQARQVAEPALQQGQRADLHHLLGDIYEKLGLYEKAVTAFQTAVRLDPDREEYHFALGYEMLIHHNFELAEQAFLRATSRLPRAVKPRLGAAAVYFAQARYSDAIDAIRGALQAAPESALGYQFLGRAFQLLSDQEELFAGEWAPKAFEEFLRLKPEDAFASYLYAASRRGNRTDSMRMLERAVVLDPTLAEAHLELGKIHFDAERDREAIASFERAVELRPHLMAAHYRLYRAYLKAGDSDRARAALEVFVRRQQEQKEDTSRRRREILQLLYTLR